MIYLISHTSFEGVKHIKPLHVKFLTCKGFDLKKIDALVFTSKNGVIALDKLNSKWKKLPSFVIGKPTAKTVIKLGGKVSFVSKIGYGDEFAKEIAPFLKGKKVLFSRAKEVVSDVSGILRKNGVKVREVISYRSVCKKCKHLEKPIQNSTLIFSSPSSLCCFLECFDWDESWRAVCIGKKTAMQLPKNIPWIMPKKRTIKACVKLAKKLENL